MSSAASLPLINSNYSFLQVQAFYMTVKSILQERGRRPEIPIHAEFHGVLDSTLFGG